MDRMSRVFLAQAPLFVAPTWEGPIVLVDWLLAPPVV